MTDKSFYQAAAAELASGELDAALWIKVSAELPEASNTVKQAKYIQLRAQEMAVGAKTVAAAGIAKNAARGVITVVKWVVPIIIILGVAGFLLNETSVSQEANGYARDVLNSSDMTVCEYVEYDSHDSLLMMFADSNNVSAAAQKCNTYGVAKQEDQQRYDELMDEAKANWPVLDEKSPRYDAYIAEKLKTNERLYHVRNPDSSDTDALIYALKNTWCVRDSGAFGPVYGDGYPGYCINKK